MKLNYKGFNFIKTEKAISLNLSIIAKKKYVSCHHEGGLILEFFPILVKPPQKGAKALSWAFIL
jgi:hypothetical protein